MRVLGTSWDILPRKDWDEKKMRMEDGGKIKKRFGLSLKTCKKSALEFSKPDSKKAVRNSDCTSTKFQTFDGYFTKQKHDKCFGGGQYENSITAELGEGIQGKHRLNSISSTRMELLSLMPVFSDWEKMAPLPVSPLMKSFSEPKRVNSALCNDKKERTNVNIEPENSDAKNAYHWKDLPKFDAGYIAQRVGQPLLTFANSNEDELNMGLPTSSGTLQGDFDLKSGEYKLTEEYNIKETDTVVERKSHSRIQISEGLRTTVEAKSSQNKKESFEKESATDTKNKKSRQLFKRLTTFDDYSQAAKEPMSSVQFKGKESCCSDGRSDDYNKQIMDYKEPKIRDMLLRKNEQNTDHTYYKGGKLISSSTSFQSDHVNIHSEGSNAVPNRTGVPENINQKTNTQRRDQKHTLLESTGTSPCTMILSNNVQGNNTLNVSERKHDDGGCRVYKENENQWMNNEDECKEDDGLDDFITSLDSDLNDDDLMSCCDELMSPTIPVRKNTFSARQRNCAEEVAVTGWHSKGVKRCLEIPDGQSKIQCFDSTSGPGFMSPHSTTWSKNKVCKNVLKECPICLHHFHSGLLKQDIDQHIAGCLESEDMTRDSDDLFW